AALKDMWEDLSAKVEATYRTVNDLLGNDQFATVAVPGQYVSPRTLAQARSAGLIHPLNSPRLNATLSDLDRRMLRPFYILNTACGKFLIEIKRICDVHNVAFISDELSRTDFRMSYVSWWQTLSQDDHDL